MLHDSHPIICDNDKAIIFNNHFYSIFTKTANNDIFFNDRPTSFSKITITEEDVYYALINLDTTKAMGPDGISSAYVLQYYVNHFSTCANYSKHNRLAKVFKYYASIIG